MELRLRLLLTLAAAATLGAAPTPLRAALPALQALQARGALVSAVVVDAGDSSVIESLAPDTRLTPASLTKLVAAAAVLDRWPGDKVFVTRLLGRGPLQDGVLQGDLVLRGDGDSSLDAEKLWSLVAQLRTRGLRTVTGRLVVEPGPFGTLPCETADRCEGGARTDRSYNALLSGVGLDYGNWCIEVRGLAEGASASLRGCGGLPLPLPVEGRIATGAAGSRESLRVERLTGADGDRLRVGGSLPAGSTERIYRAMSDPTLATGQLLRGLLRELGISVAGGTAVMPASPAAANTAPPAPADVLAEVESLPLREQVARMMRYSNNYMADVLTLDLAAEVDGVPPLRLSSASAVLQGYLARAPLAASAAAGPQGAAPAPGNGPVLASGSGLTPENRLSARDLTGLLQRMYHDTRRFPAFYGSLVVPRDAPFPYLRRGDASWLDRVALKTGTLTEPVSVTGIAGYARKRDGGFLAFAVIVNGAGTRRVIPAAEALAAAREDLVRVLARY